MDRFLMSLNVTAAMLAPQSSNTEVPGVEGGKEPGPSSHSNAAEHILEARTCRLPVCMMIKYYHCLSHF